MDSNEIPTETVRVQLNNIPATMQKSHLDKFCSLFGKVNEIEYSTTAATTTTTINSFAMIEFENTCFLDHDFYESMYDATFTAAYNFNECYQNGRFLSDLLSILVGAFNESQVISISSDKKSNEVIENRSPVQELSDFLICTYCYACADFQCERCQSPYCSIKCQHLDWLMHKKTCSPKRKMDSRRIPIAKKQKNIEMPDSNSQA